MFRKGEKMDKISFPFSIKNVFAGFAEVSGVISLEEDTIEIEFQTMDSLAKMIKSDVKDITVPITDIEEIDFKKSIWGNKLTLRVSRLSMVSEIPSQESGEIRLSIQNKYTEMALNLVSKINPRVEE
jgi:hypothetical protein